MKMEYLVDVLGWIGGAEVVVAYILISLKHVTAENFLYRLLNLKGAFLLIVNTWYHHAYPAAIENLIWIGIAIYTMIKFKKPSANDDGESNR